MAIGTIRSIVEDRLTYIQGVSGSLSDTISNFIKNEQYYLQKFTELEDSDVEDESNYGAVQRMLIAALVEEKLLLKKVIESVTTTEGKADLRKLKRAKADVAETEFENLKPGDHGLSLSSEKLLNAVRMDICNYASQLDYELPQCGSSGESLTPFIITREGDYE